MMYAHFKSSSKSSSIEKSDKLAHAPHVGECNKYASSVNSFGVIPDNYVSYDDDLPTSPDISLGLNTDDAASINNMTSLRCAAQMLGVSVVTVKAVIYNHEEKFGYLGDLGEYYSRSLLTGKHFALLANLLPATDETIPYKVASARGVQMIKQEL
jgi:hypothetical protein